MLWINNGKSWYSRSWTLIVVDCVVILPLRLWDQMKLLNPEYVYDTVTTW